MNYRNNNYDMPRADEFLAKAGLGYAIDRVSPEAGIAYHTASALTARTGFERLFNVGIVLFSALNYSSRRA